MKTLYAPWRTSYIKSLTPKREKNKNDCVFCQNIEDTDDAKNYILKRFPRTIVILNLYPYNPGHLMVLPHEHKPDLISIDAATRTEIIEVATQTIELLKKTITPDGFNTGLNLGTASGGGIPSHLHYHILPRWNGDTNFLPLLADTKVIGVDLNELYHQLKPLAEQMKLD